MREMPDKCVDLVLCDLPYAVTACKWDKAIPLHQLWKQYRRVLRPHSAIVLTAVQPFTSMLIMSNLRWFKYEWIWQKNRPTGFYSVNYRPLSCHESILIFGNGRTTYNPIKTSGHKPTNSAHGGSRPSIYHGTNMRSYRGGDTDRYPITVQYFDSDRGYYPTQKPVALFEYLLKTYSIEGHIVLDNTMGSGTTAIACINTNRNYIGIDNNPIAIHIANERIKQATRQDRMFL